MEEPCSIFSTISWHLLHWLLPDRGSGDLGQGRSGPPGFVCNACAGQGSRYNCRAEDQEEKKGIFLMQIPGDLLRQRCLSSVVHHSPRCAVVSAQQAWRRAVLGVACRDRHARTTWGHQVTSPLYPSACTSMGMAWARLLGWKGPLCPQCHHVGCYFLLE